MHIPFVAAAFVAALLLAGCSETARQGSAGAAVDLPAPAPSSGLIGDAAGWKGGNVRPENDPQLLATGRSIAERACISCHGDVDAPRRRYEPTPLRELLAPYEEAGQLQVRLMYGMVVGDDLMPVFRLPASEADALMAYLESIETPTLR